MAAPIVQLELEPPDDADVAMSKSPVSARPSKRNMRPRTRVKAPSVAVPRDEVAAAAGYVRAERDPRRLGVLPGGVHPECRDQPAGRIDQVRFDEDLARDLQILVVHRIVRDVGRIDRTGGAAKAERRAEACGLRHARERG